MADVGNIITELGGKWDSLTKVEQNAIATAIAGTRQRENFLVLMENLGKATEYTEDALNSAGTAEEKFGAYTEGIEAKINEMKASLEGWANNLIDSDLIKKVVEATTGLIKFADTFKVIQILFLSLMAIGIPKLFLAIHKGLVKASVSAQNFVVAQTEAKLAVVDYGLTMNALDAVIKNNTINFALMSQSQLMTTLTSTGLINAFKGLTKEEIINKLATMGVTEELRESTAEKILNTLATGGQTVSIKALTQATWLHIKAMLKEIATMIIAHPIITAIVAAVALLTAGLVYAAGAEERLNEKIQENSEAYKEAKSSLEQTTSSLEQNKKRIEELNSLPTRTYVEEEELAKLKEATRELEAQKELAEKKEISSAESLYALQEEKIAGFGQFDEKYASTSYDKEIEESTKKLAELTEIKNQINNELAESKNSYSKTLALNPDIDLQIRNQKALKAEYELANPTKATGLYDQTKAYVSLTEQIKNTTDAQERLDLISKRSELYTKENGLADNLQLIQNQLSLVEGMSEESIEAVFGSKEAWNNKKQELQQQYDEVYKILFPENYKATKWEEVLGQDEFDGAKEKLQEWVNAGLSEEEVLKKLKEAYPTLVDKLKEFGIEENEIIHQFKKQEEAAKENINSLEELKKELDSISGAYETLNSAIDEYNHNGSLSYDTWEKLLEVEDEYLSALVSENGQLKSNKQALLDLTKARIEEATIVRIETYVDNLLTAAKKGDLQQVLLLTSGIQANTGARMANVMAIIASNEKLLKNKNQILSTIKAMLQMGSSIDMGTDSTNKATKASEEWEQVLSYANKLLDDQIDSLQEQKEAIEKSIEEQIKAKEKEISLLEAEKEALEDKNEEKNKEIELEELQRNLQKANQRTMRVYREGYGWSYEKDPEALKEAQQELDEFYTEQEIDNIDKRIEALEKEVEALEKTTDEEEDTYDTRLKNLDKQIEKAEEYKQKWNNVKTEYEQAQNKIVAEAKLGANAEQDILNGRTTAVNTFKTNYTLALDAVAKSTKDSATRINTSLGSMISDLERLLKLQEDLQAGGNKEMLTPEQYMKTVKGGEKEKKDAKLRYTRAYEKYEKDKEKNIYTSASKWNKNKTTKITGAYTGNTYILHTNGRYILASDLVDRGDGYYDIPQGTTWYSQAYASGTLSAQSGLANVDEKGNELILPKQGRYRMMEYGDTVIPHNLSQRLLQVATNPLRFIADALNSVKSPNLMSSSNTNSTNSTINIGTIELPSVSDGQSFIKQLQLITANR